MGKESLDQLKTEPSIVWWIEADDKLLVFADPAIVSRLGHSYQIRGIPIPVHQDRLYFAQNFSTLQLLDLPVDILVQGGRFAVVQSKTSRRLQDFVQGDLAAMRMRRISSFEPNRVLARQSANDDPSIRVEFDPQIPGIVNEVDLDRWVADVKTLTSMNRYTLGPGAKDAATWIQQRLSSLPGIEARLVEFPMGNSYGQGSGFNVVARLEGRERPSEVFIVGAHYDSISETPSVKAPGAEDNASGAAGLLEMARIFSLHPPKATIWFVAFSGEEEGLVGSQYMVDDLVRSGLSKNIRNVLILDMVGYSYDGDLDCLLETSSSNKPMVDDLTAAAQEFTTLRIVKSFDPWGSDHEPFINQKIPALLTIENDWQDYPFYHKVQDVPEKLVPEMAHQILRMNTATVAHWAN